MFFKYPVTGPFTASFSYLAGGGTGGDGFTMFFYKQAYAPGDGGSLGFNANYEAVPGYGVEFDGWHNIGCTGPSPPGEPLDPSGAHIALIKDWVGNHIVYVNDARVKDNCWHDVTVQVGGTTLNVYLDQQLVLQWTGTFDRTYDWFGFSGATGGGGSDWHIIDNFALTGNISGPRPLPSFPPNPTGPTPPTLPPSRISISTDVTAAEVGSAVNVYGQLTNINGTSLEEDKTVVLSYSVGDSSSWFEVGSAETDALGNYAIMWVPSASGTFNLKTEWSGDSNYSSSFNSTTLSFLPYQDQRAFCVEPNSTVTGLEFDSANQTLSFTVSGPSGTKGYTKVTLAKTLVPDITRITTCIDGKTINYTAPASGENWVLEFNYSHSTHQVSISLFSQQKETPNPTSATPGILVWVTPLSITAAIALTVALAIATLRKTLRKNQKT